MALTFGDTCERPAQWYTNKHHTQHKHWHQSSNLLPLIIYLMHLRISGKLTATTTTTMPRATTKKSVLMAHETPTLPPYQIDWPNAPWPMGFDTHFHEGRMRANKR